MKTEESNKTLLGEMTYRRNNLRLMSFGLRLLQFIITGITFYYVAGSYSNFSLKNMQVSIGGYIFAFNATYISPICLMFSIALAIWPRDIHNKIYILSSAIKALRNGGTSRLEKNSINLAKVYITDVDREHQKRKENRREEIVPHEKRMVMRRNLKIYGIPGFILITFLQLLFKWNFPQILAIDLFIGYLMVMFDFLYYQVILRKSGITVMNVEHKTMITKDQNIEQHYKLLQKIFYMESDRYSNYGQVFRVASSIFNILAILLTLLDKSANEELVRFFAINSTKINADISMILMGVSIVFLILDISFQSYIGMKIVELKAQESMEYVEGEDETLENYKFLTRERENKNNGRDTFLHNLFDSNVADFLLKPFRPLNTIFSRNALDVGRGRYDYNNDALVSAKYYKDKIAIPAECMSTVEDSFPGRVPRFKFSAIVTWVTLFCIFIWGGKDHPLIRNEYSPVNYFFIITIVTLLLYDVIIIFFASQTWNKLHEWLLFEKEMNGLNREVKYDFMSYFIGHSMFVIILACGYVWWNERNISYNLLIGIIVFFSVSGIIGYRLAKSRYNIKLFQNFYVIGVVLLVMQGVFYCFITREINLFKLFLLLFLIPALILILGSYLKRVNSYSTDWSMKTPVCAIFLLINWNTILILLYFAGDIIQNYEKIGLIWMYSTTVILLVCGIVWEISQICKNE